MFECTRCGHKKGALSSMAAEEFCHWKTVGSEERPMEVLGREDICGVCRCLSFFAVIEDYELEPLQEQVSPSILDTDAVADDQVGKDTDTAKGTKDEIASESGTSKAILPDIPPAQDAEKTQPSGNLPLTSEHKTLCQQSGLESEVRSCVISAISSETESEGSDDALGEQIVRCCRNYQLNCGPDPASIDDINDIDDIDDDNGPETSAQAIKRNPGRFQQPTFYDCMKVNQLHTEAKKEDLIENRSNPSNQFRLNELEQPSSNTYADIFGAERTGALQGIQDHSEYAAQDAAAPECGCTHQQN